MKHNIKVISIIVLMFLSAQIIGLAVTNKYIAKPKLPLNIERPVVKEEQKSYTFIPLIIFILIATGIALFLLRFKLLKVWSFWFLLSVWLCLTISFNAFMPEKVAIAIALVFALLKVYKNNVIIHNFTELFIYGALVAIFAPLLNIFSALTLLVLISIYDYIAVRKTKHMIKLANLQNKSKLFAGMMLPYGKKVSKKVKAVNIKTKAVNIKTKAVPKKSMFSVAVLGGGDIAFPLLFAGVVMRELNLQFLSIKAFVIPFAATLSLLLLFLFGKDKKFYPAMPYLTVGCIGGYVLLRLII